MGRSPSGRMSGTLDTLAGAWTVGLARASGRRNTVPPRAGRPRKALLTMSTFEALPTNDFLEQVICDASPCVSIADSLASSGVTMLKGRPTATGQLLSTVLDVPRPKAGRMLLHAAPDRGIFEYGKTNILVGASGSGKSFLAGLGALTAARRGETSLYIDYESDIFTLRDRLLAQGMTREEAALVAHWSPEGGLMPGQRAHGVLLGLVDALRPSVVITDSVSKAMAASGRTDYDALAYIEWEQSTMRPLAMDTGACVIAIDHTGHENANGPQRRPRGSSTKREQVSGQMVLIETVTPFSRNQSGVQQLVALKSRDGHYMDREVIGYCAINVADGGSKLTLNLSAPKTTQFAVTGGTDLREFVRQQLATQEATGYALERAAVEHGHSKQRVIAAVKQLVAAGEVHMRPGGRNSNVYGLPKPGSDAF